MAGKPTRLSAVGERRLPTAPAHLGEATRAWWTSIVAEWDLDARHIRLLGLAGEAFDRAEQARVALAEHGITYTDRFGTPRVRPEVAVERDSRTAFARLLRDLNLHDDAPTSPLALRPRRR